MRWRNTYLLLIVLMAACKFANAQINVSGQIVDHYGNPVSYATIATPDKSQGTVSQIDGTFNITLPQPDTLKVYYLGLKPYRFFASQSKNFTIRMEQKAFDLKTVTVRPGINPADTIMQKVIARRHHHNPMELESFRYTAYNKFHIEINRDTLEYYHSKNIVNPNIVMLLNLSDKSHLFVSEAVSERFYRKGKMREHILTTNISGFKNPAFALLGSQLHALSCYDDFFAIGDLRYVNPISKGAPRKYRFILKDTLHQAGGKKTWMITFRPKANTTFSGMYGMLYIDAASYAVKRMVAQPFLSTGQLGITVRQEYQQLEHGKWFPEKMQSRIHFNEKIIDSLPPFPIMIGFAATNIIDPKINIEIPSGIFRKQFDVNYAANAATPNDSLLRTYRTDSLTAQELYTFKFLDTLKRKMPMLRWMENLPQLLSSGEFPLGYVNLNMKESLGFNFQERWRYGLSLMTSANLLPWLSMGGKLIHAHKPKALRYAARLHVNPLSSGILRLKYQYQDETFEKGAYNFYEPYPKGIYNFRSFALDKLNYVEGHSMAFELEYPKYINMRIEAYAEQNKLSHTAIDTITGNYRQHALRFDLRYAPGENLSNMGKYRLRESSDGPALNLSYEKGFDTRQTTIAYQRLLGKIAYNHTTRFLGTFRMMTTGGLAKGDLPLDLAMNGKGAAKIHIFEAGTFHTMPVYSFFHTRFVNGFVQHYLPIHLQSSDLKLTATTQFGVLFGDSPNAHIRKISRQANKGFYEAGILGGVYSHNFGKMELGVFYRMGEYAQPQLINNLSLVLGLSTHLDW